MVSGLLRVSDLLRVPVAIPLTRVSCGGLQAQSHLTCGRMVLDCGHGGHSSLMLKGYGRGVGLLLLLSHSKVLDKTGESINLNGL